MTKIETSGSDILTNRSQPRKERHRRGQKKDKLKAPTKIVVRHLPPTMTEEEFLKQIEMPEHEFFYFATPDWSLGNCATCRAYITLKSYDDVFLFRDRFDGYVFVDSKGAEYPAIVEFAVFQGLVKNRSRRTDNKANTIEQEPHYQQFLAKLEEERVAAAKGSEVKLEFSLDRKKEEITSTPLLQYLAHKKEKRREEAKKRTEEKRRQRDEEKERRREKQQPQVTKIMTSDRGNSSSGGNSHAKHANGVDSRNKDNANKNINEGGERKNSRAKRKAEREQRRKEQREKAKNEEHGKAAEKVESKTNDQSTSEEKASKKYSEKRERDRERNRNRKECESKEKQEKQEDANTKPESSSSTAATATAAAAEELSVKLKSKDEQISETVRNFIRSVANVKEFVPKYKQQQLTEASAAVLESDAKDKQTDIKAEKVAVIAFNSKADTLKSEKSEREQTDRQREQQQKREERRIRNKDRPSIAIYTPKPRQRESEENDAASSVAKDGRNSSVSDYENSKKDETKSSKKKVSRYSERRSERRSSQAFKKQHSNEAEDVNKEEKSATATVSSNDTAPHQAELNDATFD